MKTNSLLLSFFFLSIVSKAQSLEDSCFQSAAPSTTFASSTELVNSPDADLLQWDGTQWIGSWSTANVNLAPPCNKLNARAIWMGDQTFWTTGGEGFAAKLDQSLVSGTTYYFTMTYVSNGSYSNGNFSPYFKTNSTSDYFSAYSVGQLTPAGYNWETHTFSFTATSSQSGHQWIFIHSNDGSGMVLSSCDSSFSLHLISDTSFCFGDTIVLDAGSGYDSYSWNTGDTVESISVDSAGIYSVEVSKNSCTSTDSINVTGIVCFPQTNFESSSTNICEKFCLDYFDMSLYQPTSWLWLFSGGSPASSTVQNPTNICYDQPGSYDVTLITTNAGGSDTLTLPDYITVYPTPAIPTITQNGYTLTSSPSDFYQWQLNTVDIPGATNQSYDVLQTGFYTVVVSDSNGCKNSTTTYIQITGIDEISDADISIYPNPSKGNFTVEIPIVEIAGEVSADVVNAIGQTIFSSKENDWVQGFHSRMQEINLIITTPGIYFINIKSGNDFIRKKIVVQ